MQRKNLRLLTLVLPLLAFTFTSTAQTKASWSLADCIEFAKEHNISIQQQHLVNESSDLDLKQTKLDFIPDASGNASYNWSWGRTLNESTYTYSSDQTGRANFSLGANMILFNGLQQINNVKYAEIQQKLGASNLDLAIDNISVSIARNYLQILLNKELLEAAIKQVEVTKEQAFRMKQLVDAGSSAMGDLLEIRAQMASEEQQVIEAENSLSLAKLDLAQLLDLPADEPFQIEVPDFEKYSNIEITPTGDIYQQALVIRPEITVAEIGLEQAESSLDLAKGSFYPTLSLNGGISTWYSDPFAELDPNSGLRTGKNFGDQFTDNRSPYLGLSLSIPIFSGFRTSTNVKKAKIGYMQAALQLEKEKDNLRKVIEQSANDARSTKKRFYAAKTAVENYEESFRYTTEKFDVGMSNAIDYTVAKNQLIKSQSDQLSAKYNFIFSVKILEFYKGNTLSFE